MDMWKMEDGRCKMEDYDKEDGQMWDMVTCMQYVDDVYISE